MLATLRGASRTVAMATLLAVVPSAAFRAALFFRNGGRVVGHLGGGLQLVNGGAGAVGMGMGGAGGASSGPGLYALLARDTAALSLAAGAVLGLAAAGNAS